MNTIPNPPRHLDAEAKRFWRVNIPRLARNETIDESDLFAFELLCQDWSTLGKLDPVGNPKVALLWMSLRKLFLAQSKAFGLVPESRLRLKPKPPPPPQPEPADLSAELRKAMGAES